MHSVNTCSGSIAACSGLILHSGYWLMQLHALLLCEVLCHLNLPLGIFTSAVIYQIIRNYHQIQICLCVCLKVKLVPQADINQSAATRLLSLKRSARNEPFAFIAKPHSQNNPCDCLFSLCSGTRASPLLGIRAWELILQSAEHSCADSRLTVFSSLMDQASRSQVFLKLCRGRGPPSWGQENIF